MVHKSDLSWTAKVNNPADLYHKGDDVEAIILSINHDEKKVSPRHQAALRRSVADHLQRVPAGQARRQRRSSRIVDYGVFVRVRDGVEGSHPAERARQQKDEDGEDSPLEIGDEVEAEIANIDSQDRRLTLSMRIGEAAARRRRAQRGEAGGARLEGAEEERSGAAEAAAGGTIGELIKQKLGAKLAQISTEKKDGEDEDDESDE